MKVLVTAGNTQVPIDRVRCITSIFSGRTGTGLALHAYQRGHHVTLLTSHPEVVAELARAVGCPVPAAEDPRWRCLAFRTFDELEKLLEQNIAQTAQDAVIASAAVSDFRSAGIYATAAGTHFDEQSGVFHADDGPPRLADRAAGKVKSDEPELWLRLVRTPKLIDRVRSDWGFRGLLVKFKLEVGVDPHQLVETAERSRRQSQADFMVANLYDGSLSSFHVGPMSLKTGPESYERIVRGDLPSRLIDLLERKHESKADDP